MRLERRALGALLVLLLASAAALAQAGDYALPGGTIVPGGGPISGGSYQVVSSIGQPEAGPLMSGGPFGMSGGIVGGSGSEPPAAGDTLILLPLIMK